MHKRKAFRSKKDDDSSEDETIVKKKFVAHEDKVEKNEAELERDADIEERDKFVSRLLEREEEKTKRFDSKGLSAEQVKELSTRGRTQN
jgi:hypothetical protein